MENSAAFILQVVTLALIVIATRWLLGAKGPSLPKIGSGGNVYSIKWQWRALGLAGGIFWIVLSIWAWRDRGSRVDGALLVLTVVFVAAGLWIATGSVITNQTGITKRGLWRSRTFTWGAITEIRLLKKQGRAIELRAGSRKLLIDSRVIAFQHLLNEIEDRTRLQPSKASS